MINDTLDILDGRIINFGINFEVLGDNNINKSTVLQRCLLALESLYLSKADMAEPLDVTKIYKKLNSVVGVADTTNIRIVRKLGTNYSSSTYDIEKGYSADRRYLVMPLDGIYEFKFPNTDFVGVVL